MARTALLGWEAGAGLGHVVQLARAGQALRARGWSVAFAAPREEAGGLLQSEEAAFYDVPRWKPRPEPGAPAGSSASMGDMLAEMGLADTERVSQRISRWRAIFAGQSPDLVIADYAPGAILAARGQVPCLALGSGFSVAPPKLERFPALHDLSPIVHDEAATVSSVNAALTEHGAPPIERLPEALAGDAQCVCSLPLFDPYAHLRNEPPLGPLLDEPIRPCAPGADELFCYLREPPGGGRIDDLVSCLTGLPAPVRAFLPGLGSDWRKALGRQGVVVLDDTVPLAEQLARTRLVVHHGAQGVASAALLAGVPQVVLDFDVDKSLTAAALVERGLARRFYYFDAEPGAVREGILAALRDARQLETARLVAEAHARYRDRDVLSDIVATCEALAGATPSGRASYGVKTGGGTRGEAVMQRPETSGADIATPSAATTRLDCFALHDDVPKLVPARVGRDWMEEFTDRHIYRCLPIAIANTFGWEMLCPVPIEIGWNGGPEKADLSVRALKPLSGGRPTEYFCKSHFAQGVVTFHPDYIFRTDPGWALMASGPFNGAKDGIAPLTGIVETDWLPYTFTMNWRMTRPGRVRFEEGEPFCSIVPVQVKPVAACEPRIMRLADDPELARRHADFRASRDDFNARKQADDPDVRDQVWQRHYFIGRHPDGTPAEAHLNRLRLKEPVDARAPEPKAAAVVPAAPRWAAESPLAEIDPAQSADNEAGRQRLAEDGTLADWSTTYLVGSAADAEGCDFLVVEGLLDDAQCAALTAAFSELESFIFKSDTIDPYWNNRFLWHRDILRERPEAGAIMRAAQQRGIRLLSDFYGLTAPIYSDILQIVRWQAGMSMPPHADNANPDGSSHRMAYRDFAGIIYLNDDYEGGELYFTALDIAVRPKRGMFVAMTGGFHHEHAVLKVTNGTRLTMPSFMTFDRTRADPALLE